MQLDWAGGGGILRLCGPLGPRGLRSRRLWDAARACIQPEDRTEGGRNVDYRSAFPGAPHASASGRRGASDNPVQPGGHLRRGRVTASNRAFVGDRWGHLSRWSASRRSNRPDSCLPQPGFLGQDETGVPLDMPIVASVTTDSSGSFTANPVGVPAQALDQSGSANFEAFVSDGTIAMPWNFPLQMATVGGVVQPDLAAPASGLSGSHRAVDLRLDLGRNPGGADAYDPPTSWQGIQADQLTPSGLLRGSTGPLTANASAAAGAGVKPMEGSGVSPMVGCGILIPQGNWKYGLNEAFANVWSWTGAKVEFQEATSSSHTLGLALQGSGGGWSQNGSMSYTETGGSRGDVSGLYDNQVDNRVDYEDNIITCVLLHEWAPAGTYALLYPTLGWPHSSHPIWSSCAVYGSGAVMTKNQGTNSTIAGGVGFGPISLSAQAGWTTSIDEAFHFTQTSYLCGNTSAGWVSSPAGRSASVVVRGPQGSMMKRATVVVAVALIFTACSQQGPQLQVVGLQSATLNLTVSGVAANQPYSFGSIMLCVSSPATALITGVAVEQPEGGIRVDAFAVRPNPFARQQQGLGGQRESLVGFSSTFAPHDAQRVSGLCPPVSKSSVAVGDNSGISELGIQVSWDGSRSFAGGHALIVTYEIEGIKKTLTIPFGIWLCAATCPPDLNRTRSMSSP